MPTLASDSLTRAAIGSAVAAAPTLKAKVVEKPLGKPASASSFLASAGSVLFGIGCGKLASGGVADQSRHRACGRGSKIAALNMSS